MPVIEVENLHKRYGDTVTVDDVSFTVERGEIRTIADFTPIGAAAEAMTDAWLSGWPSTQHVLVLAVWAVVTPVAATRLFRWE